MGGRVRPVNVCRPERSAPSQLQDGLALLRLIERGAGAHCFAAKSVNGVEACQLNCDAPRPGYARSARDWLNCARCAGYVYARNTELRCYEI